MSDDDITELVGDPLTEDSDESGEDIEPTNSNSDETGPDAVESGNNVNKNDKETEIKDNKDDCPGTSNKETEETKRCDDCPLNDGVTKWGDTVITASSKGFSIVRGGGKGTSSEKTKKNKEYPYPYPYPEPEKESADDSVSNDAHTEPMVSIDSVLESKSMVFYDAIDLDAAQGTLVDGLLRFNDVRIARPIIQEYTYRGRKIKVLKDEQELRRAADILKRFPRPFVDEHPEEKIVTKPEQFDEGLVRFKSWDDGIVTDIEVWSKQIIDNVKAGKDNVSIGFHADLDFTPGEKVIDGKTQKYDAVQRNIVIDHVASVTEGRCNKAMGCGINLDAEIVPKKIADKLSTLADENKELKSAVEKFMEAQKNDLISELVALQDSITEEELKEKDMDFLETLRDSLERARRSLGTRDSKQSSVDLDEVYEKISR